MVEDALRGHVGSELFSETLWRRVNEHFRGSGQFYLSAPRPRWYEAKVRAMYRSFPGDRDVFEQAAYLVKNLVNLQRFPDANKRTASVLLEVFLESNGRKLACSDADYAEFIIQVQRRVPPERWDGRTFTLVRDYIAWQDDTYHAFVADWLRANTKTKT